MFSVQVAQEERGVVLVLRGELDFDSMVQLDEAGQQALAQAPDAGPVVADCAALAFCDSSGIGALLRLMQRLAEQDRVLRLAGVPAPVARLFAVTGLDQIFEVYPDRDRALAVGRERRDIVTVDSDEPAQPRERQNS
ncbi:STAS domain-containing protein [Streptomyces rubiginosohelvolus]|uniref:STAS domain-containing protein n=1 Tax=Streptomyces rubiginosohelvolus TaxID=67362 RepID=UPI0036BCF243